MIMYGVSGSVSGGVRRMLGGTSDSSHHRSRAAVHGTASASPARRTTTARLTDGASDTAASATDFRSTHDPRRRKPSAVMSSVASQSTSRAAMAGAPYPEKLGVKMAPSPPT